MTTRLEAETGLRNPTILESQSADKTLMTIACDLVMEKNWSFDDAIHEITFIRAEINTLLQARPKLPKQTSKAGIIVEQRQWQAIAICSIFQRKVWRQRQWQELREILWQSQLDYRNYGQWGKEATMYAFSEW